MARIVSMEGSVLLSRAKEAPCAHHPQNEKPSSLFGREIRQWPLGSHVHPTSVILATAIDPKAVRFDIRKNLEPLTTAGKLPLVLAANNDAPFSNFREFVAYAKANPGKLSVGVTPGLAGTAHVLLERIKLEMGIDVVPVAYKGTVFSYRLCGL